MNTINLHDDFSVVYKLSVHRDHKTTFYFLRNFHPVHLHVFLYQSICLSLLIQLLKNDNSSQFSSIKTKLRCWYEIITKLKFYCITLIQHVASPSSAGTFHYPLSVVQNSINLLALSFQAYTQKPRITKTTHTFTLTRAGDRKR